MPWKVWFFFTLTETAVCLSPGPAVLLVLSKGLTQGTRASLFSTLGILGANTVYFILSATSLGSLLLASARLFIAVKWIGAAYLIWVGAKAFFSQSAILSMQPDGPPQSRRRLFMQGFTLQIANPKAILFFTALLPQFIDPKAPLAMQVAILGLISVWIEFWVLWGYGTFAERISGFLQRPGFAKATDRTAGALLIAAGIGLARISKT